MVRHQGIVLNYFDFPKCSQCSQLGLESQDYFFHCKVCLSESQKTNKLIWLNKKGVIYNKCKGCVFLDQSILKKQDLYDVPNKGKIELTRVDANIGFIDGNLSDIVMKDLIWHCQGSKTPEGCPNHMKELHSKGIN